MRIMIAGPSGTGKSTLAKSMAAELGLALIPTDDFMAMEWSAVSQHVADLIADGAPRIVEGVRVPHVLRKFIGQRPGVKPCDRLIVLATAMREQTPRQVSMGKACATVLAEVLPVLAALGVVVEQRQWNPGPSENRTHRQGVGRPRSIVDVALAVRLVGHGHTDRAAARTIGVSKRTLRRFRRRLVGARPGGRPRAGEPDMTPPPSRPVLTPVRDEAGRVIGHRVGAIAA